MRKRQLGLSEEGAAKAARARSPGASCARSSSKDSRFGASAGRRVVNDVNPREHPVEDRPELSSSGKPVERPEGEHRQRQSACREQHDATQRQRDRKPARLADRVGLSGVTLEQRGIAEIRAEPDVEEIAEQWYGPYERIDPDVQQHPCQDGPRHAQPGRGEDDVARKGGAGEVADAGNEPDQRVEPEANVGSGDADRGVEKLGQRLDFFRPRAANRRRDALVTRAARASAGLSRVSGRALPRQPP